MKRFAQKAMIMQTAPQGGGSGGGGNNDDWVVGDGKTRLHISIPTDYRTDLLLAINQTISRGVLVNWGDGSEIETSNRTGDVTFNHHYPKSGDYIIELDVAEGCELTLGSESYSQSLLGGSDSNKETYCLLLKKAEIGSNVNTIGATAFQKCYNLSHISISEGVTTFKNYAFDSCYHLSIANVPRSISINDGLTFKYCRSLSQFHIADGVTTICKEMFSNCSSLTTINIPGSVTSIDYRAFFSCKFMKYYDFTDHTSIPALSNSNAFNEIPSDCEIRVPAALVDEWKAATNWSTYASQIVGV